LLKLCNKSSNIIPDLQLEIILPERGVFSFQAIGQGAAFLRKALHVKERYLTPFSPDTIFPAIRTSCLAY